MKLDIPEIITEYSSLSDENSRPSSQDMDRKDKMFK